MAILLPMCVLYGVRSRCLHATRAGGRFGCRLVLLSQCEIRRCYGVLRIACVYGGSAGTYPGTAVAVETVRRRRFGRRSAAHWPACCFLSPIPSASHARCPPVHSIASNIVVPAIAAIPSSAVLNSSAAHTTTLPRQTKPHGDRDPISSSAGLRSLCQAKCQQRRLTGPAWHSPVSLGSEHAAWPFGGQS